MCTCSGPVDEPKPNTKDDDKCLQARPNWGNKYVCATSKKWCTDKTYGKDMTDCCPCTCNPKLCKEEKEENEFKVQPFPLQKSSMYVKTVKFTKNVIENFDSL